jgi:Holliday junction DNA helicase RuvA
MIGKISGILSYKEIDHVLIDVNGLGYEVYLSNRTLANVPSLGKKISVYTELIVREDLMQLVGFSSRHEREWYRLLTGVQGVGSKAALKILGTIQISMLSRAILTGDITTVKAAQGIGPKIAQRIVSELKDKAPALMALSSDSHFENAVVAESTNDELSSGGFNESEVIEVNVAFEGFSSCVQSEALSALTNLGYSQQDAALAITNILPLQNDPIEVPELIRLALRHLSPKE